MKYLFSCLLLICGSLSLHAQAFRLTATEKPQQHTFTLDASGEINLTIDGFSYGEGYLVHLASNRFERQFEFDNLPVNTTLSHPDFLQGVAASPSIKICIGEHLGQSGSVQIIVSKEDPAVGAAKMNTVMTSPSTNLDSLLDILFRNESCFEWNSVQLVGGNSPNGFRRTGTFTNGQDFFGMEEGLILTTGFVSLAPGPNTVVPANGIFPGEVFFDQDAIDLAGANPQDIAIIEFEFIPTTDSLKFDYVFFSEEYCEFTQTTFGNDAFGFFLSGPGVPGGKQNIARLPNGDIVSTRTVNDIFFPELFVDNTFPSAFGQCNSGMPVPPERLAGVNYNGWTTKLTARAEVIPCETYTLKLVVADGSGDNFNDSGVLLEAGSFIAGLIADPEPSVQGVAGNLTSVEGCDTATITFNRLFFDSLDLLNPLEVNYNLIGGAINPANFANDFELPPGPFIIPAGDTSGVLKIPISGDINDTEGLESFIIRYDGTCNCDVNRDTFYIQDAINLQVDLGNDTLQLCAGQPTIIEAATTGGNNQYTYVWPDGQDTSRVTYVPNGRDTLIIVDVMDACGLRGQDSIQIIAPALAAATSGDFSLCTNTEVFIPIDVEGTDRYTIILEIDSGAMVFQDTFIVTQDTNIAFNYAATISILSVTDVAGCGGATSGQATIITGDIEVAETLTDPDCEQPNGSIVLAVDGGNNNFSYAWADDGSVTTANRTGLVAGNYTVTVTRNSDTSCPVEFNYVLNPPLPLVIDSITYNRPSCPGESVELAPVVQGGTPPYSFIWPDSSSMDSILTIQTINGSTTYAVIVEDACGVESTASVTITLPVFRVNLDGRYSLCNQDTARVPLIVTGPAGTYSIDIVVDSAGTSTVGTLNLTPGTTELLFTRPATITVADIRNVGGCSGVIVNQRATVVDPQLNLTATLSHPTCPSGMDGSISVVNTSNVPVTYSWSDDPSTDPLRTGLAAGSYTVSIRDAEDATCLFDSTFTLNDPPALAVSILSAQNLTCPYQLDTLAPIVTGGTPPFTYSWPDSMTVDSLLPVFVGGGSSSYRVVVTDACMNQAFAVWDYTFEDVRASTGGAFGICNAPFNTDVPINLSGSASYQVTIRENGVPRTLNLTGSTVINYTAATVIEVIEVRGADGCLGLAEGTARVIDANFDVQANLTDIQCRGAATGAISLTVNGDPGAYTYNWMAPGLTGPNPTGLIAGTYSVSIIDTTPTACRFDTFFVLTEPDLFTGMAVATTPTCSGDMVDMAAPHSGGTGPYSYDWDNGIGTDSTYSVSSLPGITRYPLAITDACGVVVRDTVTIDLPDVRASVTGDFSICNAPFNADVTINLSGSSSYTLIIRENGVARTLNLTGNTTINYDEAMLLELVEVRGTDGCLGQVQGSANITDPEFVVTAALTDIRCRGAATGAINLDVNGDSGAYTYNWMTPGLNGPNPTGLIAGTYSVSIVDRTPNACRFDTFFVLNEPDLLTGMAVATTPTCPGDMIDMSAPHSGGTGPYSYDWNNGSGTDSLFSITAVPGITRYPLAITDDCGAVVRDTITIDLPDITAMVSGNFSICNAPFNADIPITLNGSTGGYTFVVRENGTDRTIFATGDTTLNYTEATSVQLVSVTGPNGCSGEAGGVADVTDATWNVAAEVTNVNCAGRPTGAISVTVNGNNAGYTFNWSRPGLAGSSISNLIAGSYELRVVEQSANACIWDTTFNVLEPASSITFLRDSSRNETCTSLAFASAAYTGGTGQLTYTWSNGTTGPILGEVSAGSYDLSISDELGCEIVQSFNLQDRQTTVLAAISASLPELSCSITSLDLIAQQNTQAVRYQWTDSLAADLGTTRTISIGAPGRYFVEIINPANGCSAIDSIDIGINEELIELEIDSLAAIDCNTTSVDLSVSHSTYTAPVRYEWRLNGALVGSQGSLPNITQVGVYQVSVIREDNGCPTIGQTEVVIDQEPPEVTNAEPLITLNCLSPTVNLGVSSNDPVRFAWSTTNGNLTGGLTTAMTTADREGTYTVILTDTVNGCSTTESIRVIEDGAELNTFAGTDQVLVCNGLGTVLNGSATPNLPGTTGRWYDATGAVIAEGFQAFAREAGNYVFESVHPVSGCSNFDTVRVFSEAPTAVEFSIQPPPCPEVGGSVFIRNVSGLNPPYVFSSPRGETDPLGTGVRGLAEGTHVLITTDALGCERRDTFLMFGTGSFTGQAPDITVRLGEPARLGVATNRGDGALVQWTWTNIPDTLSCMDCPTPVANAFESFIAAVTVMDTNGCMLDLRQNVIIEERSLVYMPTAFSPNNGDGVNDIYAVMGDNEFIERVNDFQIFDRWGNQVFRNEDFQVNDFAAGWDGTFENKLSPPAVYVYSVTVTYYDGTSETIKGGLTLVR